MQVDDTPRPGEWIRRRAATGPLPPSDHVATVVGCPTALCGATRWRWSSRPTTQRTGRSASLCCLPRPIPTTAGGGLSGLCAGAAYILALLDGHAHDARHRLHAQLLHSLARLLLAARLLGARCRVGGRARRQRLRPPFAVTAHRPPEADGQLATQRGGAPTAQSVASSARGACAIMVVRAPASPPSPSAFSSSGMSSSSESSSSSARGHRHRVRAPSAPCRLEESPLQYPGRRQGNPLRLGGVRPLGRRRTGILDDRLVLLLGGHGCW